MVELELSNYNIKVNWITDDCNTKLYNKTYLNNNITQNEKFKPVYLNVKIYPNTPITEYCVIEESNSSFIIGKKSKAIPKMKYKVNQPYNFIIKNVNLEYIIKTVKIENDIIYIYYDMDYQEMITTLFKMVNNTFENSDEVTDLIITEIYKNCI